MSTVNKCPFCGATDEGVYGIYADSILYDCGSRSFPEEPQRDYQGYTCRELCELRKWKQVVLDSMRLDFDYDVDTLAHIVSFAPILPCNLNWPDEIPTLEEIREAFDEAVKNKGLDF